MKWRFFQQFPPIKIDPKGDNDSLHRMQLREVKAQANGFDTAKEALKAAKAWNVYKLQRYRGARHPIVQEVG